MIELHVPGDKSIAHRSLILAALANGVSQIDGLPDGADVRCTLRALESLGVRVLETGAGRVTVEGPTAWRPPERAMDCGNSGTTARLLTGLLVGLGVPAVLDGDASLRNRPMDRVVYPLQAMGGRIRYLAKEDRLPLAVESRATGSLRPLRHRPRVPSAQVKSALLLAALAGRTRVEIRNRGMARDHTERMLRFMGAPIQSSTVEGEQTVGLDASRGEVQLTPLCLTIPGDVSSAALLAGAAVLGRRPVRFRDVGLNSTRLGFFRVLEQMGCRVRRTLDREEAGEPVGGLEIVPPQRLRAFTVEEEAVPQVQDEIPMLAVLAMRAEGISRVSGAAELRVKETDRLRLLAENLETLAVACEETGDGLRIRGTNRRLEGRIRTGGDHRLAMAFGALACDPDAAVEVDDRECVAISFPGFWRLLAELGGR